MRASFGWLFVYTPSEKLSRLSSFFLLRPSHLLASELSGWPVVSRFHYPVSLPPPPRCGSCLLGLFFISCWVLLHSRSSLALIGNLLTNSRALDFARRKTAANKCVLLYRSGGCASPFAGGRCKKKIEKKIVIHNNQSDRMKPKGIIRPDTRR